MLTQISSQAAYSFNYALAAGNIQYGCLLNIYQEEDCEVNDPYPNDIISVPINPNNDGRGWLKFVTPVFAGPTKSVSVVCPK